MDRIEKEVEDDINLETFRNIFGGVLESEVCCQKCSANHTKTEKFVDLLLGLPDTVEPNLLALIQFYQSSENLVQQNQFSCSRCNSRQDAKKKLTITAFPNHLIITLNRFSSDGEKVMKNVTLKQDG